MAVGLRIGGFANRKLDVKRRAPRKRQLRFSKGAVCGVAQLDGMARLTGVSKAIATVSRRETVSTKRMCFGLSGTSEPRGRKPRMTAGGILHGN